MDQSYWEPKLERWSIGPGKTQQEKMDHAVSGIKVAKASSVFVSRNVEVVATGSYRNRTHIPVESDVDVAVVFTDIFTSNWRNVDARAETDPEVRATLLKEANLSPASYPDEEYRQDIEDALVARFGAAAVHRGDVAFDVHENTYRVEADCSATFEFRRYTIATVPATCIRSPACVSPTMSVARL